MLGTAFFVGIPSLIFGIMALTSNTTDPVGSRKKSRIGWIIFAVNVSILVLLIVAAIAFFVVNGTSSTTFDSGY
jgi:flagellar basal body-associated protein FliL